MAARAVRKKLKAAKVAATNGRTIATKAAKTGEYVETIPPKSGKPVKRDAAEVLADAAIYLADAAIYLADAAKLASRAKTGKALPAATIRALAELKADKLTYCADADEMFRQLGIKVVKNKA